MIYNLLIYDVFQFFSNLDASDQESKKIELKEGVQFLCYFL